LFAKTLFYSIYSRKDLNDKKRKKKKQQKRIQSRKWTKLFCMYTRTHKTLTHTRLCMY